MKTQNIIEKVREIVKKEHESEDFKYHISVVVKNALKLAEIKKANKEIVELGALLHDIGRTHGLKPGEINEHHLKSYEISKKILQELNYLKDKSEKVLKCILSHRGNNDDYPPESLEEKIVANADAMAHFDSFLDLFKEFIQQEKFDKAIELIESKIDRDWNKKLTLPEARKISKEKYNAIKLLLKSIKSLD